MITMFLDIVIIPLFIVILWLLPCLIPTLRGRMGKRVHIQTIYAVGIYYVILAVCLIAILVSLIFDGLLFELGTFMLILILLINLVIGCFLLLSTRKVLFAKSVFMIAVSIILITAVITLGDMVISIFISGRK